ncbi:MAG: archease [Candidatus Omnitrophica bacterium]|nr:archease [Candidatus Omnitrophota bacterium]
MKKYEIIEHTADIGIKAYGEDLKGLFSNAAVGMFDIIVGKKRDSTGKSQKFEIEKQAESVEDLLVEWLGELLFLSSIKNIVFETFNIEELDQRHIKAVAVGTDLGNYSIETEIKAVTYHMLEVVKKDNCWQAQLIFDI